MDFAYDRQIRIQPHAVAEILERVETPTLDPERPLVFTGIGTSLHACRVAADWACQLTNGALRPHVVQAHELALRSAIQPQDQIVVVSHRGTKRFPNLVLEKAQRAGAYTVAVTGQGDAEPRADVILRTCPQDEASTHTVSYLSALAVLGKLVAGLHQPAAREFLTTLSTVPSALEETLNRPAPLGVAAELADLEPILVTGYALDAVTADEAALKIKEGTYQWAEGMSVEFALHGTPAVFRRGQAAITILPATDDGGRTEALRELLAIIGVRVYTCGDDTSADLPFATVHPLLRPFVAVVPLQRLVGEIARTVGSNPDTTHLEVEPWRRAAQGVRL